MNAKNLAYIAIAALIIIAVAFFSINHQTSTTLATSTITAQQNQQNSSKVLFASTQYAQYSYLISSNPLSQQAQYALAGFNLTSSNLQNGSREFVLSVIGSGTSKTLTLAPGYKLYIVETTFGDDGLHFDSSLGDDGFVIVDPNGYVA